MTPMLSIFTLAIKFDCLFLTIYQRFHLFVGFIFNELAPSLDGSRTRALKTPVLKTRALKDTNPKGHES